MKQFKWFFLCFITSLAFSSCTRDVYPTYNSTQLSVSDLGGELYGFSYSGNHTGMSLELHGDSVEYEVGLKSEKKIVLDKKIVYSARVSLAVSKNIDSSISKITRLVSLHKGFVQQSSSSSLEVKVPPQELKAIISAIDNIGEITYKNISSSDITNQYYDAAIRLENLEKARKRYLDLLEKAQTVEEVLKVEKELERVNTDMEVLKGRLKRMNSEVAYSTINIYIYKKSKPGILGYPFVWLYKGVSWLFVRK